MIRFDARLARERFRFDIAFEAGQGVTALFGPSGSGKSTVIRLLAGLERPAEGRISAGDTVFVDSGQGVFVPPHRRRVGLVFQDAQLLPHLSVKANLTYGRFFTPKTERRVSFDDVVSVLGIGGLLTRRPATLSGGERQRVAIGRALLTSPRVLLMDEPLASLDEARKQEILPFIERLRDEVALPIIYVSHALDEVMRLAARVVSIADGRVAAVGTPAQVFAQAADAAGPGAGAGRFEAVSVLTAKVAQRLPDYGVTLLAHPSGDIVVPGLHPDGAVRVSVRATSVTLARSQPEGVSERTVLRGAIRAISKDDGPLALVALDLDGGDRLSVYVTRLALDQLALAVGQTVTAMVKAVAVDERTVSDVSAGMPRGGL
jgi:molybdate transport system ATP-binding protein